ncbi:holo-ACP synthase [Peribacillus alkalitolerans]|uniref:holo-ACP synthase n=1 Tax=Peribacillus alkalitolerans TaxID=1550385 RepID=UPI0013D24147|nr:holo-ACP synthase [Peribacillus alkalitolerans]
MIVGIGLDIVEIDRIRNLTQRQPRFVDRILTLTEKEKFEGLKDGRKIEFLAGRFAAKEAFSKALGTGIGKDLQFIDMEILSDERGKPYFSKPANGKVHLSITHSHQYAAAQVVIEE